MKAERAKIAKENRSAGEVEAKRIVAETDHEKIRIDSDAAGTGRAHQGRGPMPRASRTYAAALRTGSEILPIPPDLAGPTTSCWDDKTTIFLPVDNRRSADAAFRQSNRARSDRPPPAPGEFSTPAPIFLQNKKKREEEVR